MLSVVLFIKWNIICKRANEGIESEYFLKFILQFKDSSKLKNTDTYSEGEVDSDRIEYAGNLTTQILIIMN